MGYEPGELVEIALERLSHEINPLNPLPIDMDGGGELKDLTTVDLEINQKPARKWSTFYQADPIELFRNKV